MQILMVLNDGETYTDICGCRVVIAPDNLDGEDLDEFVKDTFDDFEVIEVVEDEDSTMLIRGMPMFVSPGE